MLAPSAPAPTTAAPPDADTRRVGWVALLICAVVALAYANSFPSAFFFDDQDAIVQNESIRDLSALRRVLWPPVQAGIGGRPFANLTYALNYAFGGVDPRGYHAVNLAIHLAATVLLFGVTRRTLRSPRLRDRFGRHALELAAVVALLWGLHPLATNIVDYASQRTEGLMGMLYLLTLYAFIRSVESGSAPWFAAAVVAALLGMASKEIMATAPFMIFLYDRTFLTGSFAEAWSRNWLKHVALAATWLLLAALMLTSRLDERGVGFELGHSWHDYALTEIRSIVRYLQLALWPDPLVFDYGPDYLEHLSQALPSALLLGAALVATVVLFWRAPAAGFAAAWFFVVLSPSSSVIPVVQQPCAENRIYLPAIGAVALLAGLAYRFAGRAALVALALAAVACGFRTYSRNPDFASELFVWSDTVEKRPRNERACNNLGNALLKLDRHLEAKPFFEQAILLSPRYADAHNNRGVTLLREGKPKDAAAAFMAAIEYKKNYADAYYNLGEAYLQLGRPADAIAVLNKSLEIHPRNPKALNNLSIALLDMGKVPDSIKAARDALALQADMPEAHYNLGNSLARAGQIAEALQEYDRALQFNPNFAKAHNNAGVLLLRAGQKDAAATRFEKALQINPQYPEARRNLDLVHPSP